MHTMQLFAPLLLAMALASHASAGCIGRWDTYGETCGKLSPTPGRCRRAGAHCDERRWGPDMCVVACAPTISRPSPSPPYYNRPYPSPSPPARPVNTLQSRSQCNAIVKAAYVAVLCRAADDSGLRHHTDRCMKEGHGYIVGTMRSSVEFKGCARCQQPGCGRGVNVMAQTPGGVPPAMVTDATAKVTTTTTTTTATTTTNVDADADVDALAVTSTASFTTNATSANGTNAQDAWGPQSFHPAGRFSNDADADADADKLALCRQAAITTGIIGGAVGLLVGLLLAVACGWAWFHCGGRACARATDTTADTNSERYVRPEGKAGGHVSIDMGDVGGSTAAA